MLRTIAVAIVGLILSYFLCAAATSFMFSHTEFGRLATGDTSGMSDRWQVLMTGPWVPLFYVMLPTVFLVAIFTGLLDKRFPPVATVVAVLPISVLSSGLSLRDTWRSLLLLIFAVLVASFSPRLVRVVNGGKPQKSYLIFGAPI
jgi:hypothetical protein